jgi:peptidoglycan hydrolase FlgJ
MRCPHGAETAPANTMDRGYAKQAMHINLSQPTAVKPLWPTVGNEQSQLEDAEKLQKAYRDFVGKTFYGQMLKSMRSTLGKPAYFHGGQTEEVFRSQLDQHLADHMTEASAEQFADPMFRLQFPQQATLLDEHDKKAAASLTDLSALRRR